MEGGGGREKDRDGGRKTKRPRGKENNDNK